MSGNVTFEMGLTGGDSLENIRDASHTTTHHGLALARHDEHHDRRKYIKKTIKDKLAALKTACSQCDRAKVVGVVERRLPGLQVIRTYRVRDYILGDVVSGLSVGILSVPLSMGFALLAAVPPILGLYTCLYPAFIYFIFGASRHIAMGTMAISSLVIATAVEHGTAHIEHELKGLPVENRSVLQSELEREQISIAVSITFLSGIFLLCMSMLQLGFIVSYIGNAFISGYLTASNIRVMTHQLILCLGLKEHLDTHIGLLHYFYLIIDVFKKITHTNIASLITSIIVMIILLSVKYGINDRFKEKLKVPVPIEMIVVIIGIIISHFCGFKDKFEVKVIGYIHKGLPPPTLPSPKHMQSYLVESCLCGVVSFVFSSMMVKLFCQRHNYPLDKNQELLASGMCNTIGGLLSCIAVSVSPPRVFLMEMTGGRTQVSYLVNAMFILLTLFALAPLLESLPICILACLIMTSCIPLFVHYKASVTYWRTNKYDFAIWLVTCLANLCINVEIGMVVGVGFSFLVVIYHTHNPYTTTLGYAYNDGIAVDLKKYDNAQELHGIKIFKFDSPMYFATLGIFKETLYSSTVNPIEMKLYLEHERHERKKRLKANAKETAADELLSCNGEPAKSEGRQPPELGEVKLENVEPDVGQTSTLDTLLHDKGKGQTDDGVDDRQFTPFTDVHTIIVDCSAIPFADTPGVIFLTKFRKDYAGLEINYVVACLTEQVRGLMARVPECHECLEHSAFASVYDAVLNARMAQPVQTQAETV